MDGIKDWWNGEREGGLVDHSLMLSRCSARKQAEGAVFVAATQSQKAFARRTHHSLLHLSVVVAVARCAPCTIRPMLHGPERLYTLASCHS